MAKKSSGSGSFCNPTSNPDACSKRRAPMQRKQAQSHCKRANFLQVSGLSPRVLGESNFTLVLGPPVLGGKAF